MAEPKTAKRPAAKRSAPRKDRTDSVPALVAHMLTGFSAKTVARGIAMGMKEPALVKLLGKPEVVHRDQDDGDGRRVSVAYWERTQEIGGLVVKESLKVMWTTKPVARGVDSVGLSLSGEPKAKPVWGRAVAEVKARLGAIYEKGRTKTTFRAPGLALGDNEGFVTVFYYARPRIITLVAGVNV